MLAKVFREYRMPILSGILIGTSYIPFPPWALAFALVPLWLDWLKAPTWRRVWWSGWITQYTLTLIGFNWVAHTIHEFGHLPWPLAILGLLLYCGFASLHVPLAGLLWFFGKRFLAPGPAGALILLPASFSLAELVYPMIFDWHLGYPLLPTGWKGVHLAEWIGFKGLSALVVATNAVLLWMYVNRGVTRNLVSGGLALALTAAGLTGVGAWLKARLPAPDAKMSVLIVQANIGNLEKIEQERSDDARGSVISRYLAQTEAAIATARPDFVVWPETAFPHLLNEPHLYEAGYAQRLRAFLQTHNLNLLTGGYGWNDESRELFNSFYLVKPDGTLADEPYSKTHLLAFGEYLPGAELFPVLKQWLPQVGQFARGQGPQTKTFGDVHFGPLICYEGLFDHFSRALALQNSQILVNVTNDSWYGTWQQPYQHLYMTIARAIEVRRPIIRSTNTGITTIGLASGEIMAQSPLHEEWQHLYELEYLRAPPKTVFMEFGYYFNWLFIGLLILAAWWRNRVEGPAQS